ncbi:MAG: sensor histidine kinase [Victivallaceae bacterium]
MMSKKSFLDRFLERVDSIDSNSVQAYILRLSREKGFLETVFNAIQEGILVVDRRLKIRYHNKAAKELLGLPDDLDHLRLSHFLRNVDWHRILQEDEDEWFRVSRQEIEILYPAHRYLQFYLVPTEEKDGYASVILRDVTETRNRTIKELETEKIQAISMLAASVAHEIGNPLNSLYLNLQLLQRMFADKSKKGFDRDSAAEMVEAARDEVERLDNIINQFLHAIRPGHLKMVPVDMKNLIIETLNFMRQEIENRAVNVKCEWPEFLPKISGDPAQLKQAFYNILKNAVQAMPEGGGIDVICSYDEDWLELEFADTGEGISAKNLGRIFEPFQTFKKEGTGLGMLVIERIVREHGAELSLQTMEGKGTSIVIKFPRHGKRVRVLPEPKDEGLIATTE